MAILKQLMNFVEQLYESGMIDETEMEQLQAPIDKKTRHLEAQGPSWKIPVISEVLVTGTNLHQCAGEWSIIRTMIPSTTKEYILACVFGTFTIMHRHACSDAL